MEIILILVLVIMVALVVLVVQLRREVAGIKNQLNIDKDDSNGRIRKLGIQNDERFNRVWRKLQEVNKNDEDIDELFEKAKRVVIENGNTSASHLQEELKVGYARAARLLDMLEEAGIIEKGGEVNPEGVPISKQQ